MTRVLRWVLFIAVALILWRLIHSLPEITATFRREWSSLIWVTGTLLILYLVIRFFGKQILVLCFQVLNKFIPWHKLPPLIGALNLDAFRIVLRKKNLSDVPRATLPPTQWDPTVVSHRTPDGAFNDLTDPDMGRAGMVFGRNVPIDKVVRQDANRLDHPNPRLISRELMARDSFIPATTLNLLAAAWIQFMVHDWLNHEPDKKANHTIPLNEDDPFPDRPMTIERTLAYRPDTTDTPATYVNTESHWWDASQIYGSSQEIQITLREFAGGRMKMESHPIFKELRLPPGAAPHEGFDLTGFFQNYWLGLSLFHTVFTLEHNAISDRLAKAYPYWNDEKLFQTARLINSALMAKIHTIEWTPAILKHPTLRVSMDANWWGLFGERIKRIFGRLSDAEEISGIIGSAVHHHTGIYSITEEFTAVYRLHPLIPDEFNFVKLSAPDAAPTTITFTEIQGAHTRLAMADKSMADMIYSFGIAHPGAVTLKNYPSTLREFKRLDGKVIDLAAVDILRDRERGVPRYNEFRRLCHLAPIKRFEDLVADRELAEKIREIYEGDLEAVDLMVGLFAETPPAGFGFSDTAFRIFILMASRRLKSDRFFCEDYTAQVYTKIGLDWIDENDLSSVFRRHYPDLTTALMNVDNAFAPWDLVTKKRPV